MPGNVILIRHGRTVWQSLGRYQGISDVPLSEEGSAELRSAGLRVPQVYVSGLLRTRQTARILFPGARRIRVPAFNEMNFGVFEGKSWKELSGRADYQSWVDGGCEDACPGGESREAFCRRVCEAFLRIMDRRETDEPLVLVAHGGTLMAILERWGRPARSYFDWRCACGCGFELTAGSWEADQTLRLRRELCFTEHGQTGTQTEGNTT